MHTSSQKWELLSRLSSLVKKHVQQYDWLLQPSCLISPLPLQKRVSEFLQAQFIWSKRMLHDDKLNAGIITHGICLVQRTCSFSKECFLICCHLQYIACLLYFPLFLLSSFSLAISSFLLLPPPPPPSLFILPHSSLSDVLSELESREQTPYIINSSLTDYPRRSHKHFVVYLST